MKFVLFVASIVLVSHTIPAQNPIELGDVHWFRDLATAQALSQQNGKPIFILFQEIPGCATCQRYGTQVMKHPLIVEAIESEFIPLAIHNNKGGEDGRVLKLFNEPSWNNPVVRIVDSRLKDIVDRLDGDYSPKGVTSSMILAIAKNKKPVPNYLQLLKESYTTNTRQVTFGMYCFWEGEKQLGKLNGVLCTRPGFVQGHEAVQVIFDPEEISPEKLMNEAKKQDCANQVYADGTDIVVLSKINPQVKSVNNFRLDQDPQYYLMHTDYKYVPMLSIQASRVNSALASLQDPDQFLSRGQLSLLNYFKNHKALGNPQAYQKDMISEWSKNTSSLAYK